MKLTKLDTIFSKYIRLRNADANGMVSCISCGKVQHWKDVDCGHFVNRKHMSLRFNEINCQTQCRYCNRFCEGDAWNFAQGLIKKYGDGTIEKLMAAKNQSVKFTQFEIDELVKNYTKLVKELL
jgi:MinD superfamily P-loop ATPase